jgi:hypothetical protein
MVVTRLSNLLILVICWRLAAHLFKPELMPSDAVVIVGQRCGKEFIKRLGAHVCVA